MLIGKQPEATVRSSCEQRDVGRFRWALTDSTEVSRLMVVEAGEELDAHVVRQEKGFCLVDGVEGQSLEDEETMVAREAEGGAENDVVPGQVLRKALLDEIGA